MKPIIYCTETQRGVDTFYLETSSGRYFLFQQTYRPGVHAHFSRGLRLEDACDFSKSRRNKAVIKTQCKLPAYIKYVESEYGIVVLKQTLRRVQRLQLAG